MEENQKVTEEPAVELSPTEEKDVESHVAQRAPVIFEIVRRAGEEELNRPLFSLWWSGIAAGLSIGFSVLTQALLHIALPSGLGFGLIEKTGYCVGFAIVILAHQQLFTENTLTAVVPLLAHLHWGNFSRLCRLWSTVLVANVTGTILFSTFLIYSGAMSPEALKAVHEISWHSFDLSAGELIARGVGAGFIIASLVWILANVENSKLALIFMMTYLVSLGNLSHVVAGSVEAAFLVLDSTISVGQALGHFFFPTLLGNVLGGSALFALLTYGQIRFELKGNSQERSSLKKVSSRKT